MTFEENSQDVRKRTLVVSEWSTFQEEGTGIARALGQAWLVCMRSRRKTLCGGWRMGANGRKGGEEKGGEEFPSG